MSRQDQKDAMHSPCLIPLAHCGHGKTWEEDCPECDAVWEEMTATKKEKLQASRIAELEAQLAELKKQKSEPVAKWPFVETPGQFTDRLRDALVEFGDLLPAVRCVLIENPPTFAEPVVPDGMVLVPMAVPEGFALVKQEPIGFVPVYPTGIIWKFASATREDAMQKMRHSTGKPYQLLRKQGYDVAPLYSVNLPYNAEITGRQKRSF